jgi:hypothetical protein
MLCTTQGAIGSITVVRVHCVKVVPYRIGVLYQFLDINIIVIIIIIQLYYELLMRLVHPTHGRGIKCAFFIKYTIQPNTKNNIHFRLNNPAVL